MAITYVTVLRYNPDQQLLSFIPKESLVFFNRFLSREMLRSSPRFSGDFTGISRLKKK